MKNEKADAKAEAEAKLNHEMLFLIYVEY